MTSEGQSPTNNRRHAAPGACMKAMDEITVLQSQIDVLSARLELAKKNVANESVCQLMTEINNLLSGAGVVDGEYNSSHSGSSVAGIQMIRLKWLFIIEEGLEECLLIKVNSLSGKVAAEAFSAAYPYYKGRRVLVM